MECNRIIFIITDYKSVTPDIKEFIDKFKDHDFLFKKKGLI